MAETSSGERTLYGWAFHVGQEILKKLEVAYGRDRTEKRMETLLLNLRSELLPAKFRRELINAIIEIKPETGLPREIKEERAWRVNEFYRYSAAILAGFYDSLQFWKKETTSEGDGKSEEHT